MVPAFPGEWRPAHPPPALSGPLGSGNRLWRSPRPGPDEQGLPQLPGRFSQGIWGTVQKEQKTATKEGAGRAPADGRGSPAGPGRVSRPQSSPSRSTSRPRPRGRVTPILARSRQGIRGLPGVLSQRPWEPAGGGPPPASLEACVRGQSPPLRLAPLSVQLAKFSEDTLSSYTEAVSTQVHSRRVGSSLASSRSPGRSSFVTICPPAPVSRGPCVAALPRKPPPHSNGPVPPDPFLCRPQRLSPGKHGWAPDGLVDFLFSHQEMLRCIWGHFLRVIQGTSPTFSHSSSLLHSLGSVTVRADFPEGPCLSRPSLRLHLGAICHSSGHRQVGERRAPSPTPISPCRSCAVWTNRGFCRGQTPARRPCCSSAGRWSPHTAATRT